MRQRFVTEQWIPFPIDLTFAFFANPNNLALLMPEEMKMRIDEMDLVPAPPNPLISRSQDVPGEIAAGAGTQMKISFRPVGYLPMRFSWVARITEFAWQSHFCDEQIQGPFEFFRHRHGMRSEIQQGRTGTRLTDEVEFSLPLGSVGHLGDRVVHRQMKKMFRMRQERLPAILEAKVARSPSEYLAVDFEQRVAIDDIAFEEHRGNATRIPDVRSRIGVKDEDIGAATRSDLAKFVPPELN